MKYTAFTSLAMASLVFAQSLSDVPSCATACLQDAVKKTTTCSATDMTCICSKFDAIQGVAAGCVLAACGNDVALNKVLPATQKLCKASGGGGGSSNGGGGVSISQQGQSVVPKTATATAVATATANPSPSTVPTGAPPATTGAAVTGTPGGGLAAAAAMAVALFLGLL